MGEKKQGNAARQAVIVASGSLPEERAALMGKREREDDVGRERLCPNAMRLGNGPLEGRVVEKAALRTKLR